MISGTDQTSPEMSEFCFKQRVLPQSDRALRRMADARGRRDRGDRRARLDILAERPRPLLGALGKLQVAPRHVEAEGVAETASSAASLVIRNAGAPIATTSSTSK